MPALPNAKHERFAQEIAKGASSRDAYKVAGYQTKSDAGTDASASRLLSDAKVQARIAEIQERAAVRAEVTLATITEDLARIAKKAEGLNDSSGLSVARAARMDIAKLHGLVVDRAKVDASVTTQEQALDALE